MSNETKAVPSIAPVNLRVIISILVALTLAILPSCGGGGGGAGSTTPPVTSPAVSLSATSLTFASQAVGTTSAAQSVTVTNAGTANLTISTVAMGGTNASDFAKSADTCTGATVIPNGTCTVSATFMPSATGSRAALLSITDNASGSPQSVSLSGTGTNPVPAITSLSPTSATAGAAPQTLTINGTNFVATSAVTYNGAAHTATYVSSTQLTISLSASDQATAGTYALVVTNPSPGGGASNSVNFSVNNPVPTTTSLSPASATVGSAGQTLTINGTNFVSTSTVTYNGAAHTATSVSSTQLTISLSAGDQATGGVYPVVVTNPTPGGGASNSINFTVNNPVPMITSFSPSSATAGAAAQSLTINGSNFLSNATVTYNGVVHTATFVSSTQITISLTTGDQATGGLYPVVVTNPVPGGGASNSINFTVNNPVPMITSFSPSSATAGAAPQ